MHIFFPAILLLSLVIADARPAAAEDITCSVLLKKTLSTGETPKVFHNKSWGIISMESSVGACKEPIEVWSGRRLSGIPVKIITDEPTEPPVKLAPPKEKPKAEKDDYAPPLAKKPAATLESQFKPKAKPKKPRPKPQPCIKKLEELWKGSEHVVSGATYWLSGVYTIDLESDGVIDDIGFKLKAKSGDDFVMRYFGTGGDVPARSIPSLKMPDENMLPRICFGRASFAEPVVVAVAPEETDEPAPSLFKGPDLAAEMKAKQEGGGEGGGEGESEGDPNAYDKKKQADSGIGLWLWVTIGVLVAAGGGGGAWYFLTHKGRKRKKRIADRYDEDGDEEDEDEDVDEDDLV